MTSEERTLTLQEFTERDYSGKPVHMNFFFHFVDAGAAASIYRESAYFLRFQQDHPTLESSLTQDLTAIAGQAIQNPDALKPHEPQMYEAYKAMHSQGISNETLFT
jgi:hypothetical protein